MPYFGQRSEEQLATCDPRLQRLAHEAIKYMDFAVTDGHRGQREQDALFDAGMTKKRWPNGNHNANPSRAMDVAPWPIDYSGGKNLERFVFLQGIIYKCAHDLGIKIRQGLDWNRNLDMRDENFRDYPHVELAE